MHEIQAMAIVDSLLRLIVAQGADALVFAPGEPPSMEKGGEPRHLSMPDPGPEFVAMILEETFDADARARVDAGERVDTVHVADGVRYFVRIAPSPSGPRLAFRLHEPEPEPEPEPTTTPTSPAASAIASPSAAPAPSRGPGPALVAAPTRIDAGRLAPLLQRAAHEQASDILVSAGTGARLRIGGEMVVAPDPGLDDEALLAIVAPAMTDDHHTQLIATGSTDFAVEATTGRTPSRYRANVFRSHRGLALALRPIRRDPPTLAQLALPPELVTLAHFRSGLVLVTGTAGSGKSTTLVALIEHLNQTQAKHIITLEDPIEYEYAPRQCLIHQRQLGVHVDAFGSGLRAALRESPDVILVGEMRDRDTIAAALTAAETGHLVLSTLHTAGAAMAIDRVIDVFPEHQQAQVRLQLAMTLRAVVTQRLLPSRRPPGRAPIIELLRVNVAVASKIREGRGHQLQSEIQKGRGEGMISFEASLTEQVRAGVIDHQVALDHADDPTLLRQHLNRG